QRHRTNSEESRQPAIDRERLECGRTRQDGVAAVPCALSIFRAGRRVELPALSAQRRLVPGRAVQHRIVWLADNDGRAGLRTQTWDFHSYLWRFASLH